MRMRGKVWLTVSFCTATVALLLAAPSQAAAQDSEREFIYTINFGVDVFPLQNVSGFSLDVDTGKTKAVPGSPFSSGIGPVSITSSSDGRFVYVVINSQFLGEACGFNNGELFSYSVDSHTGSLEQVDDVILSGICSTGVAIDSTGKFVYAASFPINGPKVGIIDGFEANDGHLKPVPGTPFSSTIQVSPGQNPAIDELAITPDGKFLYASNPNDPRGVLIFDRDTKTGTLAFHKAVNTQAAFGALAITPSGMFLLAPGLIPSSQQPGMFEFAISEHGDLTAAKGSPFPLPPDSGNLAISPDGKLVAVLGKGISMLHETAEGKLSLVPGSPFGDVTALDITFDPSGAFVLVPGTVFKVHASTGALTQVSEFAAGGQDGITVVRTGTAH